MLGPYKFNMQATEYNHGYYINSGHYTTVFNRHRKACYCNDNKIAEDEIGVFGAMY